MYGLSCDTSGCKEQPLFSCICSNNTSFCKFHTSDHLISQGDHTLTSIVQSFSETQKNKIFEHLNRRKQVINKNIMRLNYFSERIINQIIQEVKRARKLLMKERSKIEFMIKSLYKHPLTNKELIREAESSNINAYKLDFKIEKISKAIRNEFFIERKYSRMKDDEYAMIFDSSLSNKIDLVNLDTFKKSSLNLPVNDMINCN